MWESACVSAQKEALPSLVSVPQLKQTTHDVVHMWNMTIDWEYPPGCSFLSLIWQSKGQLNLLNTARVNLFYI